MIAAAVIKHYQDNFIAHNPDLATKKKSKAELEHFPPDINYV